MLCKKSSALFLLFSTTSLFCDSSVETHEEAAKPVEEAITPPSRFEVRDGYNFFIIPEFIFWIPQEDGLIIAQSGVASSDTPLSFDGHIRRVKPHFSPGVRLTLGGNMPYDNWDILASWTYFHSKALKASNKQGLYLWSRNDSTTSSVGTNFKGVFKLTMDLLDAEMGRSCWLGTYFSIRPFISVRGLWLTQDFTTQALLSYSEEKTHAHSNFTGGGPRAGVDFRLHLYEGWSIIAKAAGSLLYGLFNAGFKEYQNGAQFANSPDKFRSGISTAQMLLGLQWDTFFAHGKWHFGGSVSWEQNIFFGVNKMQHWQNTISQATMEEENKNLSVQGVTIAARLDF